MCCVPYLTGDTSGTGVCFTRNPSTGENLLYGEYLVNAQGEDVVAGIRTPNDIATMAKELPAAFEVGTQSCFHFAPLYALASFYLTKMISCGCGYHV